jgi:hypothetical protein
MYIIADVHGIKAIVINVYIIEVIPIKGIGFAIRGKLCRYSSVR